MTFLVDTGATTTAIPAQLGEYLGLRAGPAFNVTTANGVATAYATGGVASGSTEGWTLVRSLVAPRITRRISGDIFPSFRGCQGADTP